MDFIKNSVLVLAQAANGSPIVTTIVIILFYLGFAFLEEGIEKLIWGKRFEHWLDPFFISCFIAYSAYAVYGCALFNSQK